MHVSRRMFYQFECLHSLEISFQPKYERKYPSHFHDYSLDQSFFKILLTL